MMTRTKTSRRAILAGAGLSALIATSAIAGLPKVLDYVPADAPAVIVIENISTFDQHFSQFVGATELPATATPSQALNQLGIGQNLDMNSSAALVVLSFDIETEDAEIIFLAPTRDFTALIGAYESADGGGGGISAFFIEEDTVYAKQIGSWAAMSDNRDTVANFTGKAGNLGAFEANLGAAGMEVVEGSDVFISVNPATLAPFLEKMQEEFESNAAMFAGANQEQMEMQMEMMTKVMDGFVRDGSSAGYGIRFGAMGVSGNGSISFRPGTESAKFFTSGGDSSSLMDKLPAGPFLFAGAVDNTAPIALATMEWFKDSGMMEMNEAMGMGAFNMSDLYEFMNGFAGVVYPNPAGLMGGVFANSIVFSASDNPAKLRSVMKDKYARMSMDNKDLGMSITSTYTPDETKIAGKSADGYSININMGGMDPGAMMFNPMQMIFGSPTGPSGYIVEANGGVYQSYSRNAPMLEAAVEGKTSFTSDKALSRVASQLPEGRYAEFYVGIRPILDQVVPFLGMFGIPALDLPDQMPPIGFGVASRDGGAVCGTFVPAQTIKGLVQIAETFENMAGPGDPGNGGPGF